MNNIPKMKIGIVAVSRDCFPESLSVNRRKALVDAYAAKYDAADIYECPVCIVESEIHMVQALEDIKAAGCNALCVYLGNFGPEISETLLAKHFDGPKMFVAAAEETGNNLVSGRPRLFPWWRFLFQLPFKRRYACNYDASQPGQRPWSRIAVGRRMDSRH